MTRALGRKLLGVGIYTPQEAALYARVPTATMRRWVHGNRVGQPVVHAQLKDDPERIVTFLDFVQALAIRAIRTRHKVPLNKIRETVNLADTEYGIGFPFAMHHKTFLFGNEIVLDIPEIGLIQASGKHKRHGILRRVAELYMKDLTFSEEGLATLYQPLKQGARRILLDPARRLGQPLVDPCDYTVEALVEAYRTEGSIRGAAVAYGVHKADIEIALSYDDYVRGTTAA